VGRKLLAVGTEDRLAQGMRLALAFFAPIPRPTQLLHLPLLQTQGKGQEVLEPIEPPDRRPLLPDGLLSAGTLALHGLLAGGQPLEQWRGWALRCSRASVCPWVRYKRGLQLTSRCPRMPPSGLLGGPYTVLRRPSGRGRG